MVSEDESETKSAKYCHPDLGLSVMLQIYGRAQDEKRELLKQDRSIYWKKRVAAQTGASLSVWVASGTKRFDAFAFLEKFKSCYR